MAMTRRAYFARNRPTKLLGAFRWWQVSRGTYSVRRSLMAAYAPGVEGWAVAAIDLPGNPPIAHGGLLLPSVGIKTGAAITASMLKLLTKDGPGPKCRRCGCPLNPTKKIHGIQRYRCPNCGTRRKG